MIVLDYEKETMENDRRPPTTKSPPSVLLTAESDVEMLRRQGGISRLVFSRLHL